MKVTDVLIRNLALKVTYVLTHPGNRCPDICELSTNPRISLNDYAPVNVGLPWTNLLTSFVRLALLKSELATISHLLSTRHTVFSQHPNIMRS